MIPLIAAVKTAFELHPLVFEAKFAQSALNLVLNRHTQNVFKAKLLFDCYLVIEDLSL